MMDKISQDFKKQIIKLIKKEDEQWLVVCGEEELATAILSAICEGIDSMDLESICENVHKAYCKYHKERTGQDYWTKGDYSLLNEDGKEYDRRTAKTVITDIIAKLCTGGEK